MRKPRVRDERPLIGMIYSAAEDPTQWPALLEELAKTVGASVGTFDAYNSSKKEGSVSASFNLSPEFLHGYATHFAPMNPWLTARKRLQPGHAVTGQMFVADDVLLRSEFYQDFLRQEDVFHVVGARIFEKEEFASQLTLLRPRRKRAFGANAVNILDRLTPHLEQAMRLHHKLSEAGHHYRSLLEVINTITIGVFLVNDIGYVVEMNRAASEIVESCDGLLVRKGVLEAARSNENTTLKNLIAASALVGQNKVYPGGTVLVSRKSQRRSFMVLVTPSRPPAHISYTSRVSATIFVSNPEAQPALSYLRELFQLTPAEARFTELLLQGKTTEEVAGLLRITINTARTHLKRVLLKTGVHSQSDLARLLVGGVTGLKPSS
jgi:DNA-binding CsgD family transcriptional regulator